MQWLSSGFITEDPFRRNLRMFLNEADNKPSIVPQECGSSRMYPLGNGRSLQVRRTFLKRLSMPQGIQHLGQTVALSCSPWIRKGSTEQITNQAGVPLWNVRLNSLLGGEFWVRVPSKTQPVDMLPSYVEVQGVTVSAFRDELSFDVERLTVLPDVVGGFDA